MSRPIRHARPMILWGATAPSGAAVLLALGILAAPRLGVSATAPSGRYLHSAILDSPRHRMLMFGGTSGSAASNELWALSLEGAPAWQPVSNDPTAPYRYSHVAILDPVRDQMLIFGGVDQNLSRQNDVWVYPQNGPWSQLAVAGTPPAPRNLHCGIYDPIRDRLIVFGGYKDSGHLNDVWALSLSGTPTWTQIFPSGTAPSPRRECSAVYDPVRDRMIVIGGVGNGDAYFGDAWALSLDGSPQWTQLDAGTSGPLPRSGQSAVYDPARDLIWLFGGRDLNQVIHNDLWTLSLSGTPTWARVSPNGDLPFARAYHSAVLDPSIDRMVVFGGYDGGRLSDTRFLHLAGVPTWFDIGSVPPAPPTQPFPRFSLPVAADLGTIELGQTFSVTVSVQNWGTDSDDGRISVSFPALTDPSDGQRVESSTSGDPTGVVELPAGASLVSSTCQPLVASCLAIEYRDNDWLGGGLENHDLTLTVRPQAAGTFYFYLRASMHKPGTPCTYVNGVPAEGDPNFSDQQGWAVHRFAVTVIDTPQPRFTATVGLSATLIELGQSFTITTTVQNDGAASDDGRIAVSFPALTSPSDSAQVSGSLGPEYLEHPAGSPLLNASCQPVTASCLAVEYQDSDWLGGGLEPHQLTLTVRPQAAGVFYLYVRATMHQPATPCTYVNAMPPGGEGGYTDQQGWVVRRFEVIVDVPQPRFTSPVGLSATSIVLGQSFTVTTTVQNDGATSDDGRIVVSFPALTSPSDSAQVSGSLGPEYLEHPAGSPLLDASCQPVTASCLAVEYQDSDWLGLGQEPHQLTVTVQPQVAGTFYFYLRATMHKPGTPCTNVNGVPAEGDPNFTDQQGWVVHRFAVTVDGTPRPSFTAPVGLSVTTIVLGQSFTITTAVANDGATSDDGRVVVSFPALTGPSDSAQVSGSLGPEYLEHPAGSPLLDASCQPVTASCLAVEYQDSDWLGLGLESHQLTLTVRPQAGGTFYFYLRATMHQPTTPCTYVNAVPPGGEGGYTDQQGFPVTRYAVTVHRLPIPLFGAPVAGIPSTVQLGQSFTLTASVRNDGGTSDDGRIVVSFPAFAQPGDQEWAASPSAGDSPGYTELPAGSVLQRANCQSVISTYLVAEYGDDNWLGDGAETNDLVLTVTPQVTGAFYVDVRATMHHTAAAGCPYVNVLPDSGGTIVVDQQGWTVTRYAVQVLPPTPTTVWSPITSPPGGPSPRFSASVVYHPGRDALVFYGGADGTYSYLTDSWVLPLAPGGSWTQLTPGGPVPESRYNQSLILNPVEDNLVLFGGYHDVPLNDLTALALSPLVWWFPATPSGPQPSPRFGASAVYDPVRHRMLVIGGFGSGYLNDVWEYRLPGNGTWTQLNPAGTPMPARTLHAAVYDPVRDRVLVFGGEPFRNDVWELTLGGTLAWNELHPSGSLPERRRQHSMIYDPARDRLVVFGGFYVNRMNDVWALSLGNSPAWARLFSSTTPPGARMGHAAVYDPIRDRMVVFGGNVGTNQFSNELWVLTFDTPTPTQVSFGGAEVSPDHVRLTWSAPDASRLQADVERSAGDAHEWTVLGSPSLEGDRLVFEDRDVVAGTRYGYRLVAREPDPGTVLDEQWVTVPPRAVLALAGASPNPAPDDMWVAFSLPAEGSATLELFDLRGRMLAQREVGTLGPGEHRVTLSQSRRLPAGVYLVRLIRGDRVLTAKAAVVR